MFFVEKWDYQLNYCAGLHFFKVFKKTTKFRKYNIGLTKFIINRRKYYLRKKRSNYMFYYLTINVWARIYGKKRHLTNFNQFTFFSPTTLLSSNFGYFFKKNGFAGLNSSSAIKYLFLNKSLFLPTYMGMLNAFSHTRYSLVFFKNSRGFGGLRGGKGLLISDWNLSFVGKDTPTRLNSTEVFLKLTSSTFRYCLQILKLSRKIIMLLVMYANSNPTL